MCRRMGVLLYCYHRVNRPVNVAKRVFDGAPGEAGEGDRMISIHDKMWLGPLVIPSILRRMNGRVT